MSSKKLFSDIKKQTNGMLSWMTYEAICEAAKTAPAGTVVDIGPAQGGSTISLGLGRRDAGLLNTIYSIDVFHASNALKYPKDLDANIEVHRENFSTYDLQDSVRVIPITREDPLPIVRKGGPIGVLFIDADGLIDRDFNSYFDQLVDGATIILDDYEKKIDEKYVRMSESDLERYFKRKSQLDPKNWAPLGKHYTIFRLANKFAEMGYMELLHVHRNTAFFRKKKSKPFVGRKTEKAASDVRETIMGEFEKRRRKALASA